jgi:hypothetical protein
LAGAGLVNSRLSSDRNASARMIGLDCGLEPHYRGHSDICCSAQKSKFVAESSHFTQPKLVTPTGIEPVFQP